MKNYGFRMIKHRMLVVLSSLIKKNQIKFGDMNINLEKFKQSFNKLGTNKFRKIQKDYKKNAKKLIQKIGDIPTIIGVPFESEQERIVLAFDVVPK